MLGKSLKELGFDREVEPQHLSVKEAVFPFSRFPEVDILLGPEMKSTGEVMGIGSNFGIAFAKSQSAAGYELPTQGTVFVSVHDQDKREGPARGGELPKSGLPPDRHQGRPRTCETTAFPRTRSSSSGKAVPTWWTTSRTAKYSW